MAERKCSCCGLLYSEEKPHDYEQCVKDCEKRVETARHNWMEAMDDLNMAHSRLASKRKGLI